MLVFLFNKKCLWALNTGRIDLCGWVFRPIRDGTCFLPVFCYPYFIHNGINEILDWNSIEIQPYKCGTLKLVSKRTRCNRPKAGKCVIQKMTFGINEDFMYLDSGYWIPDTGYWILPPDIHSCGDDPIGRGYLVPKRTGNQMMD